MAIDDAFQMRLIAARISARYTGRVDAQLSFGDGILLIRDGENGDGSVVIHSTTSGVLPRNWMPAGTEAVPGANGSWVFTKGEERLEVYLDQIYSDVRIPDQIDPHLEKIGSEVQFSDALGADLSPLAKHLGLDDLELISREHPTQAGPIDLLCQSGETLYVVEVKRRKCAVADLFQVQRYIEFLRRTEPNRPIQGLLVGPAATRGLLEEVKRGSIGYLRLSFQDIS